ncbi:MAG: DUF309 domain-containing protein [Campylobacterota bacterium]|nr:DUF309 domain-containing protein [Campylobacterota bacterium]
MLKINHNLKDALRAYLSLLEREEYFEAHEALEEAWHPLRERQDPMRHVVKGFINGAISFEHIKRNRKNGKRNAQKVIASYERYKHLRYETREYRELFDEAYQQIESLKSRHKEVFDVLVS